MGAARAVAGAAHRSRRGSRRRRDHRRRRVRRRRGQLGARRCLLGQERHVAASPGSAGLDRPRRGRLCQRPCLRHRRLRRRPAAATDASSCSRAERGAGSRSSRTDAPPQRRRSPAAGSTWSVAWTGADRSHASPSRSRWARSGGSGFRARPLGSISPPQPRGVVSTRSAAAPPESTRTRDLRGVRRRCQALAQARTSARRARRYGCSRARRTYRLGGRRRAGRHDPDRLRVRRPDSSLVEAPGPPDATARTRRGGRQRPDLGARRRPGAGPDRQRRRRVAETLGSARL